MPTARARHLPTALSALSLSLLFSGPARADDLIDQAKAKQQVAAQMVEFEVRETTREVTDLLRTRQYAQAAERVRSLLVLVEKDIDLPQGRRDYLKSVLRERVRQYEGVARRTSAAPARPADPGPERQAAEADRPRRTAPADDPAATARGIISNRFGQAAEARDARARTADRYLGAVRGVDDSAAADARDYALPADWKERIARPSRTSAPKLSEDEQKVLKSLGETLALDFKDRPFQDFLETIQKQTGLTLVVDKKTLEEAKVEYDTNVSVKVRRATARTILKTTLADLGLTYIIKDGVIQVVTPEAAKSTMTTRGYYVGDLAGIADVRLGPLFRELQVKQAIAAIVDNIKGSIDPGSWAPANPNGGTITYDPISMSLIIKQTAEVHYQLGGVGR